MSNPQLALKATQHRHSKNYTQHSEHIDRSMDGIRPCITRMATVEELMECDKLPPPVKRKSRVMNYSF